MGQNKPETCKVMAGSKGIWQIDQGNSDDGMVSL